MLNNSYTYLSRKGGQDALGTSCRCLRQAFPKNTRGLSSWVPPHFAQVHPLGNEHRTRGWAKKWRLLVEKLAVEKPGVTPSGRNRERDETKETEANEQVVHRKTSSFPLLSRTRCLRRWLWRDGCGMTDVPQSYLDIFLRRSRLLLEGELRGSQGRGFEHRST